LRDGGQVDWPIGLQGKNQKALDKLLPEAYTAAAAGKLTPKLMKQVRTEMATMRQTLRDQCQKEEIDTSSYLQAIEFYNSLESSINALERPDARKQLSGAYSPRARNVQELVDFMTDNGLKFAPSSPGNENAYQVAHDAFVRYARAAQSGSGFQPTNAPVGKR
jgi:aminopeptidase C